MAVCGVYCVHGCDFFKGKADYFHVYNCRSMTFHAWFVHGSDQVHTAKRD